VVQIALIVALCYAISLVTERQRDAVRALLERLLFNPSRDTVSQPA